MNYTGNKFKLLPQILPLFPSNIDIFVDLFCGGLDVAINVDAKQKICNDIERPLIDLYNYLSSVDGNHIHNLILRIIHAYQLSKTNKDGYLQLRQDYNKTKNPILLYTLLCYSFNNQSRFNSKGMFNIPFGKREYNVKLQKRLPAFTDRLDSTYAFSSVDFRQFSFRSMGLTQNSFVYVDPPYLITTATYTENNHWSLKDEEDLLSTLDQLHKEGIKFGLSNIMQRNNKTNTLLKNFASNYNVHEIDSDYMHCSYHKKDRYSEYTREVYICNYD